MKPRVFVSSTYYDLKYIRENLDRFLTGYGFEPVLFENGSVTYEHELQMDESCYNEVKLCHMMILIIGGRYGSPSNNQDKQEIINRYEKVYMSITRKEFKTAKEKGIPIFIFIDKNVYAEFQTYKENKNLLTSIYNSEIAATSDVQPLLPFRFAHVDSTNIFEFINDLKPLPIQSFESFDEISDYLTNQWSGMFYLYLNSLQDKKSKNEILDSVSELKNISAQMKDMLNVVGKSVIVDTEEYEKIIKLQNQKILDYFAEKFVKCIQMDNVDLDDDDYSQVAHILYKHLLDNEKIKGYLEFTDFFTAESIYEEIISEVNLHLFKIRKKDSNSYFRIKSISFFSYYNDYTEQIKGIIDSNKTEYMKIMINRITLALRELYFFPF